MSMNLRAVSIALVLSGVICSPVFAAPQPETSAEILLRGARTWESKARPDLAKNLLNKLLLIEPNSPDALAMLGKIAIREGNPAQALPYLQRLEKTAPNSAQTLSLRDNYQSTTGGPRPAVGTTAPMLQPQTPRPAEQTAASVPVKLPEIKAPEVKLAEVKPPEITRTDAPPKVAQRSISVAKKTPSAKLTTASRPAKPKARAIPRQASTVRAAKPVKPAPPVEQKMTRSENDAADIEKRNEAIDALDDGNFELAENILQELLPRRPLDPEVLGGLGMLRLRQGRHAEAETWFTRALANSGESGSNKWRDLVRTAGFWKNMRLARDAMAANRLTEAEDAIQQALIIQPGDPDTLALLGDVKVAANQPAEAERQYRAALAKQGYNTQALRGLIGLLSSSGRTNEAINLVKSVHRDYADELAKYPDAHAGLLRAESELYIATNRNSRAIQALEKSVSLAPKDPWSRFSLAKLYISLNMSPLAKRTMEEGSALAPDDPDMHYAHALISLKLDDYAAALNSLDKIPEKDRSDKILDARNRALHQYYFQQAEYQMAQGNRKEAIRIMSIAHTRAAGNYTATEQVAEGWFKLDMPEQALAAMRALPQPAPLDNQVYYASMLNRAKQDQELAEYLPGLDIPDSDDLVNQKYRRTVQDIEFAMAGRQYDKLMTANQTSEAQRLADNVLNSRRLSNSDYFRYHRDYFSRSRLPDNAIPLLQQEKARHPGDLDVRWDLAYAYHQNKQDDNARVEIRELLSLTRPDDTDRRLRIARLQQSIGDTSGSRETVDDLVARNPGNSDILLQAGNIARSEGRYSDAVDYYEQTKTVEQQRASAAPATAPAQQRGNNGILLNVSPNLASNNTAGAGSVQLENSPESNRIYQLALANEIAKPAYVPTGSGNAAAADRAINSLEESRPPASIETGLDIKSKTASAGTSTYNAIEIPVIARFPVGYSARGSVQVDAVSIDPGTLPSTYADAALFGKIQANQAVPAQPLTSKSSGVNVGLGFEQYSIKADIGLVGIGFPVTNLVGGIRKGGDIGKMSYSLSLSRRAETGSQLSYAGARDPVSGAVWGGVTNTGVSLYLSTKLQGLNVSGYGSYGLLRGKNVQNNDRLYLRGAVDYDLYRSDDMVLNLGLSANYMSYSKNLSNYTFGHGGYYSPQSSLSFSLPLEIKGREGLLSYQLQASASYSFTREDASPFYPTDGGLQALGNAGPNFPSGYTQAIYPGGRGGGLGFALRGAVEYRVAPHFIAGGKFSIERSDYYFPNSAMLYLKYLFKPETGPVKLTPTPVIPYSQY